MRDMGTSSSKSDLISELERLGRLRAEGTITEVEFETLKMAKMARLEKTPIAEQRAVVSGTTTGSRYCERTLPLPLPPTPLTLTL